MSSKEQMTALLNYMWEHNTSHAAELAKLAGRLKEAALEGAAEKVISAQEAFDQGNAYLAEALKEMED